MEELQEEVELLRQQIVEMGGTPLGGKAGAAPTARKKGVAICSEQIEDEDFVPPSFPKGAGTRVLIEGAMSASSMFPAFPTGRACSSPTLELLISVWISSASSSSMGMPTRCVANMRTRL